MPENRETDSKSSPEGRAPRRDEAGSRAEGGEPRSFDRDRPADASKAYGREEGWSARDDRTAAAAGASDDVGDPAANAPHEMTDLPERGRGGRDRRLDYGGAMGFEGSQAQAGPGVGDRLNESDSVNPGTAGSGAFPDDRRRGEVDPGAG